MAASRAELDKCLEEARATYSRWLEKSSRNWRAKQARRSLETPLLDWLGQELDQHALLTGKSISKRLSILRKAVMRGGCIKQLSEADLNSIRLECEHLVVTSIAAFHQKLKDAVSAHGDIPDIAVAALRGRAKYAYEAECQGRINTGLEELSALSNPESRPSDGEPAESQESSVSPDVAAEIERRRGKVAAFKEKARILGLGSLTYPMIARKVKPSWKTGSMITWYTTCNKRLV